MGLLHLVSPLVCRGPWMSTVVLYCWCHSDSASVLLYFTSVSDKWELFDSEGDMEDIGGEYFALESLENKQDALH